MIIFSRKRSKGSKQGESQEGAEQHAPAPPSPDECGDEGLLDKFPAADCAAQCEPKSGELRRYLLFGARPEPMPSFIGPVEDPVDGRTGIACSGGGIRSAAFNLGALQSLASAEKLSKAKYIAAVSGGSYIAAAFAMVAKRWATDARPGPTGDGYEDSDPAALRQKGPFAPGSPEEQYLRNRSSYMAPSGSEKLYLGFRVVLGLLFNLIFLSLPLAALGMLAGATIFRRSGTCDQDACDAVIHRGFWIAAVAAGTLAILIAGGGMIRRAPSDRIRQLQQTWSTRLLIAGVALGVLLVAAPALVNFFQGVHAADPKTGAPRSGAAAVGTGGVVGLLAALTVYVRQAFSSAQQFAKDAGKVRKAFAKLNKRLQKLTVLLAGAVIGPLLLYGVIVLGASLALANSDARHVPPGIWWIAGGAAALFVFLYLIADITSWSLHPYYKRRLASAFALKRLKTKNLDEKEKRRTQLVPPVDPPDDHVGVALERDYDKLVPLSKTHQPGWPTLIVCAAANISNPGATPPGRNVTSFTFSARAIGGPLIGGASTPEYEEAVGGGDPTLYARFWAWITSNPKLKQSRRQRDLTLPAAVAMSGAAVSPSMGKMTNRSLTFLLALANARLGVWLPNPRWVLSSDEEDEDRRKRKRAIAARVFGRPRPVYLVQELLGRNRIDDRYLYVTDGGHYENLGLVELLRRGCTRIYCFDASGGETFKELGDAIALARSELGVEIEIDPRPLKPDPETSIAKASTVCGSFTFNDKKRTTGTLIYVRNVLTARADPPDPPDAPWDVHAYHGVDPNFPHNSTVDQLYTDQKFEGYRVLGEVAGKHALSKMGAAHPGE
jgi:prepilin signal peptidase PulO-like enzyme (type II secretory pathway)